MFGNKHKGFTLIEILLVMVIVGLVIAVVVPRVWRASADAKYNILRQHCAEIASVANMWCEAQVDSQDQESTASLINYVAYIAGQRRGFGLRYRYGAWIAYTRDEIPCFSNAIVTMPGRIVGGENNYTPTGPAVKMLPRDKVLKNPFSGQNLVETQYGNPGATAILAAIEDVDAAGAIYASVWFQGLEVGDSSYLVEWSHFYGFIEDEVFGDGRQRYVRQGVFMTRVKNYVTD